MKHFVKRVRKKGMSKQKEALIANAPNSSKKGGKSEKYEERSKKELYGQAKKVGVEGRSKMNNKELINALRNS